MNNAEALKIAKSTNPLLIGSVNGEEKIQYVERIISALESIDHITAERDAAIADIKEAAQFPCDPCEFCKKRVKGCDCCGAYDKWEWRGVKHEQRKKEKE